MSRCQAESVEVSRWLEVKSSSKVGSAVRWLWFIVGGFVGGFDVNNLQMSLKKKNMNFKKQKITPPSPMHTRIACLDASNNTTTQLLLGWQPSGVPARGTMGRWIDPSLWTY